jgi:hypothetical protein
LLSGASEELIILLLVAILHNVAEVLGTIYSFFFFQNGASTRANELIFEAIISITILLALFFYILFILVVNLLSIRIIFRVFFYHLRPFLKVISIRTSSSALINLHKQIIFLILFQPLLLVLFTISSCSQ